MAITDRQLLAMESAYWSAIRDRDARAVGWMTDPDCLIVGASGVTALDAGSMAQLVKSAPFTIHDFLIDPESVAIVRPSDDVVAISYRVHEDVEVDGTRIDLDAFDASVWKRTEERWTCVLHTESIAGDPFGRDRTKTDSKRTEAEPRVAVGAGA